MSSSQAQYVYGVVGAGGAPPRSPGIGGADLRLVTGDGIAALVSDIDRDELTLGREAMTAHARVLEEALTAGTVLPMRFGAVLANEEAVRGDLLEAHRDDLRAQLTDLEGKVELRLRASYEESQLMREVVQDDPEVARLSAATRSAPQDATYYARIELGERVAAGVERRRQADAAAILGKLRPLALAVEAGDPPHERVAVNASFLVQQATLPAFDKAVDEVGRAQAGRMTLKYTGPLPPYSFVRIAAEA